MVHTQVEVDIKIWRKLRAYAVENGLKVSEALEKVLKEYFNNKSKFVKVKR